LAHYGCSPTGPLVSHWRAGGHSAVLRCVRTARTALGGRPRYLLCSTQWVLSVTVAAQSSAKLNSGRIRSAQHSAAQRSTAQHSTAQHSRIWQNCAAHAVAGSGWPILRNAALQVACGELHTLALADDSEVNTSIQPRRNPSIGCAPQCSQHSVLLSAAPARAIDYREHRR
jgi:hypothetical protein